MRTNSLSEGVREGLDPELEGSEIPGLVETLHLLGHERLVNLLSLSVGKGDWVKQQSEDKSGHETKRRKNTERNRRSHDPSRRQSGRSRRSDPA